MSNIIVFTIFAIICIIIIGIFEYKTNKDADDFIDACVIIFIIYAIMFLFIACL